jgi:glycosyltransferase involved in cell wall biosynthesis
MFDVGYLARVAPEKGLHFLCEAYRRLRSRGAQYPSRLWAAGYLAPEHESYFYGIRSNMASWGLSDQFRYHGELDRAGKLSFLKKVSVFSVPATYDDPKGLYLLEAMAAGIPVVQPRRGAFTEIVENTGGGILVEPDNADDLADALARLRDDPDKREELGLQGRQGVRAHYSAAQMAEKALDVYRHLLRQ